MAEEITAEVIDALIEAGLRHNGEAEYMTAATPLRAIHFRGGDRTLAGIEFVCAIEHLYGETIPKRTALPIMSRLDKGRGTVANLAAIIDRWRNPPPRKRREKLSAGQMCLGL